MTPTNTRQAQSKIRAYNMRIPKFSEKGFKIYTVPMKYCKYLGLHSLLCNINNHWHCVKILSKKSLIQIFLMTSLQIMDKVSIKFWENINHEFFKVEYRMKLSQYFGNFCKGSHKVTQQNILWQSFQNIC